MHFFAEDQVARRDEVLMRSDRLLRVDKFQVDQRTLRVPAHVPLKELPISSAPNARTAMRSPVRSLRRSNLWQPPPLPILEIASKPASPRAGRVPAPNDAFRLCDDTTGLLPMQQPAWLSVCAETIVLPSQSQLTGVPTTAEQRALATRMGVQGRPSPLQMLGDFESGDPSDLLRADKGTAPACRGDDCCPIHQARPAYVPLGAAATCFTSAQ
jgi:hypothetical protein